MVTNANTMAAFFSGVDDKYELDDPGIHLVVGSIDTKNMKYAIAASVVGSHRRFIVDYDKLVDATPVDGMKFHEKVLDYVDYSTPTVKKFKPGTNSVVPVKWTKKETSNETWNDPGTWGYGWEYDKNDYDYSDPFYWQGDTTRTSSSSEDTVKLWSVIDLANDYVKHNANDLNRLHNLRDELMDFITELDENLELAQFCIAD